MNRTILSFLLSSFLILPSPALAEHTLPSAIKVDSKVAVLRNKAMKDNVAWKIVESVSTEVGPRPDGSEAEARARTWAVAKMKELGFQNVHVEKYNISAWQRGTEKAEVVSPYQQPLVLTALEPSAATPADGITLPVAYFQTFNDLQLAEDGSLKGKIAFVSNQMRPTQDGSSYGSQGMSRFVGPNLAAKKGASAIVIKSIGTDHSRAPHTGHTKFEPGVIPIPAAALSVVDAENLERICKRGEEVMLHLTLTPKQIGERESGNVVGEFPGTDGSAGTILVGGHLDSWDLGTGAIDDGAGMAITATAAKLVHELGPHRRTIRVVWFGDEETGGLGGDAYAKQHSAEMHALAAESDFGADSIFKFNVNFPESANDVTNRIAAALMPLGVVRGTDVAGDGTDVKPMLALGVPAIDLNQDGTRYFDWHHTAEDTLDRVDIEQLRQNVAVWSTVLFITANAKEEFGKVKPKE
jgi:Peptidase family M28